MEAYVLQHGILNKRESNNILCSRQWRAWLLGDDSGRPQNSNLDATKQQLYISISSDGIASSVAREQVSVIRKDDDVGTSVPSGGCGKATQDCYDWKPETGSGEFKWTWKECCTDGMVLGRLPSVDFCLDVTTHLFDGLQTFYAGDFDNKTQSITMTQLPLEKDGTVQVCGYTCGDFCSKRTSCASCTVERACGWCETTKKCEPKGAAGACPNEWIPHGQCCKECTEQSGGGCSQCIGVAGCAFDSVTNECISGVKEDKKLCRDADSVCWDEPLCAISGKRVWMDNCDTPSPTQHPTTTKTPTHSPIKPTESPTSSSPTLAPTQHPITACARYNNCTKNSDGSGNSATFAIAGGVGFVAVLAALWLLLAAKRKRQRQELRSNDDDKNIELGTAKWGQLNPAGAATLVGAISTLSGDTISISTNNPRLANILKPYITRVVTRCDPQAQSRRGTASSTGRSSVWRSFRAALGLRSSSLARKTEWMAHTDPSTRRTYFYNTRSEEVTWTMPEGLRSFDTNASGTANTEHPMREWTFTPRGRTGGSAAQSDEVRELVKFFNKNVWKRHTDDATGRRFYVNSATAEAVWLT